MANAETYARYCGAAALAEAKGISRLEAGGMLAAHPRQRRMRGWVYFSTLQDIMGVPRGEIPPRERVTLSRWLKEDGRDALVFVARHFIVVRGGQVVEDDGYCPMRGKVRGFILLASTQEER
jgi:hypothetical protein